MKVLVYGSLNIDYVYSVEHFVRAGETISSDGRNIFCGGKGLNQAIAFSRYGIETFMAGAVGKADGKVLTDALKNANVNTDYVVSKDMPSGHTVIQNTPDGENCIILFGGANQSITKEDVDRTIEGFGNGDYLILQNEINLLDYIIERAHEKKMPVVLNPSPMNGKILKLPLDKVDIFVLNEIEACGILGLDETDLVKADGENLLSRLKEKFPNKKILLTLGEAGSLYSNGENTYSHGIYKVKALDTTGAGDTFMGYFVGEIISGKYASCALKTASAASAIAVGKNGASVSIPYLEEVKKFLGNVNDRF